MFALKLVEVPEGTPPNSVGSLLKLKTLPATIGRGKDATIVIQHRRLSRLHCRFYLDEEKLHVRDLGSTNGTSVNGTPIDGPVLLRMGDRVSAGGVVFQIGRLVDNEMVEPETPAPSEIPEDATVADLVVPAEAFSTPALPSAAEEDAPVSIGTEAINLNLNISPKGKSRPAGDPVGIKPAAPKAAAPPKAEPAKAAAPKAAPTKAEPQKVAPQKVAPSKAAPVSTPGITWPGAPTLASVSSVSIDVPDGKAASVAADELPVFSEVPLSPDEIDLSNVAEAKKDASVSALGNFFTKQSKKRK